VATHRRSFLSAKIQKDPVDKNAIIIFAEKIESANAAKGYFVAKTFTSDARAQALKYERMELVTVTENDPASGLSGLSLFVRLPRMKRIDAKFIRRGSDGMNPVEINVPESTAFYGGERIELMTLVAEWAAEIGEADMRPSEVIPLPEGIYSRSASGTKEFAQGEMLINDEDKERVILNIQYDLLVKRSRVVSHFDVQTRGRCVRFEAATEWGISVAWEFVTLASSR
jgi:hypothetical protein